MPGLAELSLATDLGSLRLPVPHGQRSIEPLSLSGISAELVLLPGSRPLRTVLQPNTKSVQVAQVLAEAGGLSVPVPAAAAVTARDAIVRWDAEQNLDLEAWLAAQSATN